MNKNNPTALQAAIASAGHHNSTHFLRHLGFNLSEIHAAVRRGEVRWTSSGMLEVVP